MSEELDTTFTDNRGRPWTVRLTVSTVHRFCGEKKLALQHLKPDKLDAAQLLDLAYLGTRHHSRAVVMDELAAREEFFDSLEGEPFVKAQEAAVAALVNFILRSMPEGQRQVVAQRVQEAKAAAETAGTGPIATVSPDMLVSTPQA